MQSRLLHGAKETLPSRNSTPTPRDLFGSNTSFPLTKPQPDVFSREYSSASFRQSLDFDRTPQLPPARHPGTPDVTPNPANALAHAKSFSNLEGNSTTKMTIHDYHTLSAQLSGITTIATNLQREMANLSRRSKDNATDLMSIKEATKNRDEEIRRSLRDLQSGLTSFEATDRLLESGPALPRLSIVAASNSSGSESGRDSTYGDEALLNSKVAAASTAALERILREMPTKEDQDSALHMLQEIQGHLKVPDAALRSESEEKILSVLQELKEREDSRGRELVVPGSGEESQNVLSMLEALRVDLHVEKEAEKEGEKKILDMLQEIKEKEATERNDEKILEAIDELKAKEGGDKMDTVVSLLEELRDREFDVRAVALLEEVISKMDNMASGIDKQVNGVVALRSQPSSAPPSPPSHSSPKPATESTGIPNSQWEDLVDLLQDVKDSVATGGGGVEPDLTGFRELLENSKQQWGQLDNNVLDALKELRKDMETIAQEQQAALGRIPHGAFSGFQSQALTKSNPLPPDLDNEAAITALANIASTTTRTDITLSSINALIKVFQKETHSGTTNTTEALNSMSRFLDEIGDGLKNTTAQTSDARKILEVVRTGVCSGNDRLADFDGSAKKNFEEVIYLQKHLQRLVCGADDEVLWKRDAGVKDDVEDLSRKVEELAEKNATRFEESATKTIEAIGDSNSAHLIEELKGALGAMAQRSLDAFQRSEDAIHKLLEESATSAQRNIDAIQSADPTDKIAAARSELAELAQKSISLCEQIDAKCSSDEMKDTLVQMKEELSGMVGNFSSSFSADSAEMKDSLKTYLDGMDGKIEDAVATAAAAASSDEKTAQSLDELKIEVSETLSKAVALAEKPDDAAKLLEPIAELRREVANLVEQSNSALAAPAHFPQADEIKRRIEILAKELHDGMARTAAIASESLSSTADTGRHVTSAVEHLRRDIGELGTSIAAAVSSNTATLFEEGMKGSFESMKDSVLVKVEQGLVSSDKAVGCIADLSQQTKEAIENLKAEVTDLMYKSISMAVAPRQPDTAPKHDGLLEALKSELTDVIISSVAAGTGSEEVKELIEGLKSDLDAMGKQIVIPSPDTDEKITSALEAIKHEISELASKSTSAPAAPSAETTASIDTLRQEVREMMEKASSMIGPAPAAPAPIAAPAGTIEQIEVVLASLKSDVNDMVESSLAAAIANSTFDSEENVKEAIEELKRDVRDTLQKSMIPSSQQANDASEMMIREAMGGLRQDVANMFEKKTQGEVEDKQELVSRLDTIKGQFGDFLQMSANVEIKDAVDTLKQQVHGLLERSNPEYAELKQLVGTLKLSEPEPIDPVILETLQSIKAQINGFKGSPSSDGGVKESIEALREQIKNIAVGDDLKEAIEALKAQAQNLPVATPAPAADGIDAPKDAGVVDNSSLVLSLKTAIEEIAENSTSKLSKYDDVAEVKLLVEGFKKEFSEAVEKQLVAIKGLDSAAPIEALRTEMKELINHSVAVTVPVPGAAAASPAIEGGISTSDDQKIVEVRDIIEKLRTEVKELAHKSPNLIATSISEEDPTTIFTADLSDLKEAVVDANSAVGECRVEVAIVKALVEEKTAEIFEGVGDLKTAQQESKESVNLLQQNLEKFNTESTECSATIQTSIKELQTETKENFAAWTTSSTELQTATQVSFGEVKTALTSIQDDTKDSFEELNKTVESAQVDVKEAVIGVDTKLEAARGELQDLSNEVKSAFEASKAERNESFTTVKSTLEAAKGETKEEIAGVKKVVEEVRTTNEGLHDKTRKQVEDVISLVDGLQTEWKGHQPTLFNALLEMKELLLEAQKAAANQPVIEPPPAYDDADTQSKLDQLLAGNVAQAKRFPQLDLLDTIQRQVNATSTDISQFIVQQKAMVQENAAEQINLARRAEIDLEKATSEKKIIEAATDSLRREHDKLLDSVDLLREESEDLRARKLRLTGEVAGMETALSLRREELLMLEARGEALERRILDGVIEQSRALLMKPANKSSRPSKADRDHKVNNAPSPAKFIGKSDATAARRHLSLSTLMNEGPAESKSGRTSLTGGTLGLGQKEYSASLGLLGRSQSVKHTSYSAGRRKSSMGSSAIPSEKENTDVPVVDEEEEYGIQETAEPLESEDEGSVIRVNAGDEVEADYVDVDVNEEEDGDSVKRKNHAYPALGLDFSDGHSAAGSRVVSGVSDA